MIRGRRPKELETYYASCPYQVGEWVLVHVNGNEQKVGQVKHISKLVCTVKFYKTELWTEVESGSERYEFIFVEHSVPVTSIACTLPEEVAKNLLLLQGVEL